MLVANKGSGAHPYVLSGQLFHGPASTRNLADAVHYIATLYGHIPGMFDQARVKVKSPEAAAWLEQAATAFAHNVRSLGYSDSEIVAMVESALRGA